MVKSKENVSGAGNSMCGSSEYMFGAELNTERPEGAEGRLARWV